LPTDRRRLFAALVLLAGGLAVAGLPATASAKVYLAREEALALAFPGADRVEPRDIVLTDEQKSRIEKLARAPLDSSLVTLYVGWQGGTATRYAIFDTHQVRTFPETFLVVLSASGEVLDTQILAFHEPEEYKPPQRWLDRFAKRRLDDDLQVGRGVVGITGQTLSTRAVTSGIRRALAIWQVLVGGN
jgi:hypothetical protein